MIAFLLFAGHETVTGMLGNTLVALARHPDQRRLLRDDPDLIDNAVEELLRFDPPAQVSARQATADFAVAGVTIRPGRQHRAHDRRRQPRRATLARRQRAATRSPRSATALVRLRRTPLPRGGARPDGTAQHHPGVARRPRRLHRRSRPDRLEAVLRPSRTDFTSPDRRLCPIEHSRRIQLAGGVPVEVGPCVSDRRTVFPAPRHKRLHGVQQAAAERGELVVDAGGTTGCTVRVMSPSRSRWRSVRVSMRWLMPSIWRFSSEKRRTP